MNVLVVGDIVGRPGRTAILNNIKNIKKQYEPDLIIINAENSAGGFGITPEIADNFLNQGVDVITTGNHVWRQKDIKNYLDMEERIIRPINFPPGIPGRGSVVIEKNGVKYAVINLIGRIFMEPMDCPFRVVSKEIKNLKDEVDIIIVDFHAEATSEKIAMGWHLDGKTALVFGTHTHVQTADERVLPGGTAYITDIGMTGPINSVIGMEKNKVLKRFLTGMPYKFDVAEGETRIEGAIAELSTVTGKANKIMRLQIMVKQ